LCIRLKSAAGHHHSTRAEVVLPEAVPHANTINTGVAAQQRCSCGVIQDRNTQLLESRMQCSDQMLTTSQDVAGQAAPELKLSIDLECLPTERWLKADTQSAKPQARFITVADQHFSQIRIAPVFGQPAHVIEILLFGIGAEIDR